MTQEFCCKVVEGRLFKWNYVCFSAGIAVLAVAEQECCVSLITHGTSSGSRWEISSEPLSSHRMTKTLCTVSLLRLFTDDYSRFQHLHSCSRHEDAAALRCANKGNREPNKQNRISSDQRQSQPYSSQLKCCLAVCASFPRAVTPNRAGFCCFISGTISVGLQNHQGFVSEVFGLHGSASFPNQGEQLMQTYLQYEIKIKKRTFI